jgi:predicted RecA/RadA family phage recombinase
VADNFVSIGDNITFTEYELTHPVHGDGLVNAGDPCLCGRIIGVANADADAISDPVVVSTRGIWDLEVTTTFHVRKGSTVFIDPATAVLSDDVSDTPFGLALETVAAGVTVTISIKLLGATAGAIGAGS